MNKAVWKKVLWTAAKVVVVGAGLYFVGRVLVVNWPEVRAGWRPPHAAAMAAAFVALFASYFTLYAISLAVLRRVGYRLTFRSGLRPFFVSLLGRYVPGRFVVIVGKVFLYEKRGVPRVYATLAAAYENVFAAIGGISVALATAATVLGGDLSWTSLLPVAAGAALLFAFIHPSILRRLLGWGLKRVRLGALDESKIIGSKDAARFALSYAGYCLTPGVFFAFFAAAFVPLDATAALAAGAAYVAASVLGYAAVFAPSGLGVREGVLVLLLQSYMSPGEAAFLAVASRLAAVAAEVVLAGFAGVAGTSAPATETRADA
ncbi:MAG: lysylphosphatidylglycerol synthase domain-containing protein [Candidatus Zixiibacteriota bacterium]